jgi:hypothetical protein
MTVARIASVPCECPDSRRTFDIVSGARSAPTLGNVRVWERVAGAASCSEISHEDTTLDEIEDVA